MTKTTLAVRVIVPMKPVVACKRRLAHAVPDVTREALVLLMLHRTVQTFSEALGKDACWVIGGDAYVRQIAEQAGGTWVEDRASDLNATVLDGMLRAVDEGARAAIFVPADVPMITVQDVHTLIDVSDGFTRPVGVEAHADGGTNALLVPAGIDMPPALGHLSYNRHRLNAKRAGFTLTPAPAFGLVFDLDSPADLVYARESIPGFTDELARWEERVVRDAALIHPPPLSAGR